MSPKSSFLLASPSQHQQVSFLTLKPKARALYSFSETHSTRIYNDSACPETTSNVNLNVNSLFINQQQQNENEHGRLSSRGLFVDSDINQNIESINSSSKRCC